MPVAVTRDDYVKAKHLINSTGLPAVEAAIAQAIAAERERCALICETNAVFYRGTEPIALVASKTGEPIGHVFARAIRANG